MAPSRKSGRDQELKYQTIFESDMVGILSTDLNGEIQEANDYFLKMIGYTRKELEDGELSWRKLTAPEFLQKHGSRPRGARKKSVKAFEKEYIHKDGHRVPVIVGLTLYHDGSIIAIVLDITQSKKTEKRIGRGQAAFGRASGSSHSRTAAV